MPKVGTPFSNNAASTCGAPSAYTDDGPPDRMIAFGRLACMSVNGIVDGTISENTRHSRTRRAISWAYCAPKSTTRTVSKPSGLLVTIHRVYRPGPAARWRRAGQPTCTQPPSSADMRGVSTTGCGPDPSSSYTRTCESREITGELRFGPDGWLIPGGRPEPGVAQTSVGGTVASPDPCTG